MSLQVWLPLTKDLRNQGLADVTVTNNGATFNSAGKLGGCYSFSGGSSSKIVNTFPVAASFTTGSLACWVKFNAFPNSSSWMLLMRIGNLGGYEASRFSLTMEYTNKINISINGSGVDSNAYTHSLSTNTWYHLCTTFNGTVVKLYINGNEVMSKTATIGNYTTAASAVYIGGTTNNCLNGYMNDCRYYDHALSPMEVKELAKGLVLHYPLNRNGWGQENLILNSGDLTLWSKESGVSITWDSTEQMYKITDSHSGSQSRWGIYQNFSVTPNTTYTLTIEGKKGQKTTGVGIATYESSTGWPNGIYSFTIEKTKKIYTFTSGSNHTVGRIYLYIVPGDTTTNDGWFNKPKLEVGNKATPWCPNSSDVLATTMDLNGTTEYDCSGFCNNGTKTGTFTWSSDTPKYQVSTFFEQGVNSYIVTPAITFDGKGFTGSYWFKSSSTGKSGYQMPLSTGGSYEMSISPDGKLRGGIYIDGTRYVYNAGDSNYLDGKWHMFTMTYDGTTICRYVDGVLKHSQTISGTSSTTSQIFAIGRHGASNTTYGNINLYESDIRIYGTALSASDVQSLYQNSAYIDNNGNVYGAVHSEV